MKGKNHAVLVSVCRLNYIYMVLYINGVYGVYALFTQLFWLCIQDKFGLSSLAAKRRTGMMGMGSLRYVYMPDVMNDIFCTPLISCIYRIYLQKRTQCSDWHQFRRFCMSRILYSLIKMCWLVLIISKSPVPVCSATCMY